MKMKLIINADDFGLCNSVNEAIIEVFKVGNLTSTTLMVNMPGTNHAVQLAKENPGLAIGLHFCITEGKPLSKATSFIDENGFFINRPTFIKKALRGEIIKEEVTQEFKAQIDRFKSFGIPMTHTDSHQHLHMLPFVFDAMKEVLAFEKLPVRIVQPPKALDFGLLLSKPIKGVKQLVNYSVASKIRAKYKGAANDTMVSMHDSENRLSELDATIYQDLLIDLSKNKVIELMVHPFKEAIDLKALYNNEIDSKMPFLEKCWKEHEWLSQEALFSNYQLITFKDIK